MPNYKMDMAEQEQQQRKASEYDRTKAEFALMCELSKGRISGEEEGWVSENAVRSHFAQDYKNLLI